MTRSVFSGAPARLLGLGLTLMTVGTPASADLTPRVLHHFEAADAGNGANPYQPPVYRADDGALLGVTSMGGGAMAGTYYQLQDGPAPAYQASAFADAGALGLGTGLVVDNQGRTYLGSSPFMGSPALFRWVAGGAPVNAVSGALPEGSEEAFRPRGLFAVDADDNVYFGGGTGRLGNGLFRLDADGALTWLVDFQLPAYVEGDGGPHSIYLKGQYPVALAVDDAAGMLYGINVRDQSGGAGDVSSVPDGDETAGTLFSVDLSQAVGGGATPMTLLHTFAKNAEGEIKGNDAGQQALVRDGEWLYGTTTLIVWRYRIGDADSFTVLHRFGDGEDEDGETPRGPLVLARDGNLYGTTERTSAAGAGALYRIRVGAATDRADDAYELLHLFDVESDGAFANGLSAGPVNQATQILYGATRFGGATGDTVAANNATGNGTVYALDLPLPATANIDIQAQPATLTEGESTTLNWSVTGADQCVGEGKWGGNKALQGSETLTPDVTGEFTYTLTCVDGDDRTLSASATVKVNARQGGQQGGGGGGGGSAHYLMLLALAVLLRRRAA
tara:strand:+ start:2607 stop:4289 length:1683 start_codon:yes stop_codon:yes gene_type:complete